MRVLAEADGDVFWPNPEPLGHVDYILRLHGAVTEARLRRQGKDVHRSGGSLLRREPDLFLEWVREPGVCVIWNWLAVRKRGKANP